MTMIENIGKEYFLTLSKKKRVELAAVYCFFEIKGIAFEKVRVEIEPDEPADIVYDGRKFQVTKAPAQIEEVVGKLDKKDDVKSKNTTGKALYYDGVRTKSWSTGFNIEESLESFIIEPIENKRKKYGSNKSMPHALKGVTLLIYCNNSIVLEMNKEVWNKFKNEKSDYFVSAGFDEMYLLDSQRMVQIYP